MPAVQRPEPDIITYNAAFSACEKGKQADWASEHLVDMLLEGLDPCMIICVTAISAFEFGKQPDMALEASFGGSPCSSKGAGSPGRCPPAAREGELNNNRGRREPGPRSREAPEFQTRQTRSQVTGGTRAATDTVTGDRKTTRATDTVTGDRILFFFLSFYLH